MDSQTFSRSSPASLVDEPASFAPADIGERLRAARTARRQTLRSVASKAGVSESFLSQVERGVASASIASLRRIASALGLNLVDLFQERNPMLGRVLRVEDRPCVGFGVLGRKYKLHSAPDRAFDVLISEFEPGGSTGYESYSHGDSEELAVVLEGSISVSLGIETYNLATGDSISYRSSTPHKYVASLCNGARVLFIVAPPSL